MTVEDGLGRSLDKTSLIVLDRLRPSWTVSSQSFSVFNHTPTANPIRNVTRLASLRMGMNEIDPSAASSKLPDRR